MRIYLFDDNPNVIAQFSNPDVIVSAVKNNLASCTDNLLAKRFLNRALEIELVAKQVSHYIEMRESVLGSSSNEHEDTILLLDCKLEGDDDADVTEAISGIILSLQTRDSLVVGLATTKFNPVHIVNKIKPSAKHLSILVQDLVGCTTPEFTVTNIVKAILHWEFRQNAKGKYQAFFNDLFNGSDHEIVAIHPPTGKSNRIRLFYQYFEEIKYLNLDEEFVDRQIYEMCAVCEDQGVGVEAAWLLAMMKANEIFPNQYQTAFQQIPSTFTSRTMRGKELPLIPPQLKEDRIATLLAFGDLCEKHFVKDGGGSIQNKSYVLKAASLKLSTNTSAGEVEFELNWPAGNYVKNVSAIFSWMKERLLSSSGSIDCPKHNSSSALVAFLAHTAKAGHKDDYYFLSGTCINVKFKETSTGSSFLKFIG